MKEPIMEPEDQAVLLPQLRAFQGLSQEEVAANARLDVRTVRRYESGERMPRRGYEQIVEGIGLPLELVEACNLPAVRAGRSALVSFTAGLFKDLETALSALDGCLTDVRRAALAALLVELDDPSIQTYSAEDSWEVTIWRFVERLCHESAEVASGDAERALKLAELALRAAERAPGKGERRQKIEGYAWIFLGNARRVGGTLPGAEAALSRAAELWALWTGATPIPLAAWRLPDMQASLRRHQGNFAEALKLHDQALALATPEAAGRILLNKAGTLEQKGQPQQALAALQEAEARINGPHEPRLLFGVRFNRIVNLLHLKRYEQASERLPEVQAMAESADRLLDNVRVIWLQSKIAAGLGRRGEAETLLDQVRREFLTRGIAYDTAVATLELAVLYLEDGRTAEVKVIAAELTPIFAAQRVARETLASVKLFLQAVEQETVTAELARGWLQELRRVG
ncbi:MAG TPA: helix-turn-helix transcriptional regulator [Thermoanaerobaculia bacterium]|nr:helix-turn-helix transcriptional regulator [Thermoanaerobaculia bacterium]